MARSLGLQSFVMFGGTRRFLALVLLWPLMTGCTGATSEPERAQPPVTAPVDATTTIITTTTTSTTTASEPPNPGSDATFELLLADPALTVSQQVEAAYLHSWDIYLHAVNTWDTRYLDLVFADGNLDMVSDEVERLREEGMRVTGHVEHDYAITVVDHDNAVVMDGYRNYMVATVDGEEPDEPSGALRLFEHQMTRVEDRWVVTWIRRHEL